MKVLCTSCNGTCEYRRDWVCIFCLGRDFIPLGGLSQEQAAPIPNDLPAVWDLVIGDMKQRHPHNGRDSLIDAYQEALDLAVYLRQLIYERDHPAETT